MPQDTLLSSTEAAELLGIDISTLRRWDESGRFPSQKTAGGHRRYPKLQVDLYLSDLFALAREWVTKATEIPSIFYCPDRDVFQARLAKMEKILSAVPEFEKNFSLIVLVAGEIGNNSFDHNLGNWADVPGVFFGYDVEKRMVVLADRGQGILTTLKRVRATLTNDEDALRVAFTEIISGRAPEERGNGLKLVRNVVTENPIDLNLTFQTGNALLELSRGDKELDIKQSPIQFHGCLALIKF